MSKAGSPPILIHMTYLLRLIPLALLLTACAFIPPGPGDTVRDCDTCPELTLVPAGTFVMGAPADDPESDGDEGPQHDVTIAAALAIGTTEVTRAQFAAFIAATGYAPEPGCRYFTGAGFDNDPKASCGAPPSPPPREPRRGHVRVQQFATKG